LGKPVPVCGLFQSDLKLNKKTK